MCRSEEIASGVNGRAVCNSTGSYPAGSPDLQPTKFTGKERDSETGLDYFGARYMSSAQGRFTSPDSAADEILSVPIPYADLQNPQSLNLYSYVQNNPLRYTDPDGHDYHVCVDNNSGGGQNCVNLTDDQYAKLYNQQNGKQGIGLPGGLAGNITCGGQVCGSASYFEPSLQSETASIGLGLLGGKAAELAFPKIAGFIGGLFGRTAGGAASSATQSAAKVLLSGGSKQAAKEVLEGLAEGAQKASAKRAVAGATSREAISISQSADGTLTIAKTRRGFDGSQTFTKTIDSAGNSSTLQTAHDAAGKLVHYDPKN
jgi:RHS repeat-associated protein